MNSEYDPQVIETRAVKDAWCRIQEELTQSPIKTQSSLSVPWLLPSSSPKRLFSAQKIYYGLGILTTHVFWLNLERCLRIDSDSDVPSYINEHTYMNK